MSEMHDILDMASSLDKEREGRILAEARLRMLEEVLARTVRFLQPGGFIRGEIIAILEAARRPEQQEAGE